MQNNTRVHVLESLIKVYKYSGYGNRITDSVLDGQINEIYSGFFTRLFYGCIENNIYLDYILRQNIKISVNKLNPHIHYILIMAFYQFIFMDSIPDHAVVDESVKLAKKYQRRYSGFVNGVLRGFIRKKKKFSLPKFDKEPIKYLSVVYSHPEWLVDMWVSEYGKEFTQELLKANQSTAPIFVRKNKLKLSDDENLSKLTSSEFNFRQTVFDDVFYLDNNTPISRLLESDLFNEHNLYIQDLASSFVGHIVVDSLHDKKPKIIDMCAAPGGKSLHIASLLHNNAQILCWDIHQHRVDLIKKNAADYGVNCICAECKDSSILDLSYQEFADLVLLDAPCSGLGTIRRHPDIKIHREKEDIISIAKLQNNLLINASRYVKIGGVLIYSVCTLSNSENELQIQKFIKKHKNFTVVEQKHMNLPDSWYNTVYKNNIGISLYPNIHGTDGFYICKMIRTQ